MISGNIHEKYMEEVKRHFKPEFINRIDEIIVFNALDDSAFIKIAHKFVGLLQKRLADRDITLNVSDAVYNQIAKMGVDHVYRPINKKKKAWASDRAGGRVQLSERYCQ